MRLPIRLQKALVAATNDEGSTLVIVTMLTAVLLILCLSIYQISAQDASLAHHRECRSRALYLAESGLSTAKAWLEAQEIPPDSLTTFHPFGPAPDTLGGGTYTVSIEPDALNPGSSRWIYTIASSGDVEGHQRALEADVATGTYASFVYYTNREHMPGGGNPLWFGSADLIDGPLFTNDQVSIWGDPTFLGAIQSAYGGPDDPAHSHDPMFLYYNGSASDHLESAAPHNAPHDNPTFAEGYELGVTEIPFPSHSVLHDLRDLAGDGGISLNGNYECVLGRPDEVDGSPMYGYLSYRKDSTQPKPWNDVDLSTINGVVYVNGTLQVSGVLDGEVTLVSGGHIEIVDDIVYRDSDESGPREGCDDILGLISGADINVVNNDANGDDCVIHAAMIAINNTFRVENWNTGTPRGSLSVHGSIVQDFRGPVGTGYWDGDEMIILTGYSKNYHYDQRLQEMAPPSFIELFHTGRYVQLRWREVASCP